MFFSTTTIVLATFCLPELSFSRPLPEPQEVEPITLQLHVAEGLELGAHIGCGDNDLGVDINSNHIPLIPCTKTDQLFPTSGVKLPLGGRIQNIKRVDPVLLPISISGQKFIPFSTSSVNVPLTAKDSSIPRWSSIITSTSISTLKDFPTASKRASKTHTHHRASLKPTPPPTIIIDSVLTPTKLSKITHTHHRFSKTHKTSKTSKASQNLSVHPHPLPVQTLTERWETQTKSVKIKTEAPKSTHSDFTWISPPQTRFPITPASPVSFPKSTTLATKMSKNTSVKVATWHPPAETLYPPIIE